ncbi:DUF432 domain-containing protein [Pontiellaceae bacterium B1224]|nr:DUF432 domain-containing protein [Pontiellaceae bacterium B1224]
MIDIHQLWKPNVIEKNQTLDVCMGSLHAWIHRGEKEWRIAHELQSESCERCASSISTEPFRSDLDWMRLIVEDQVGRVQLKPQLPDRPLIVRPEMPMCLMPKQSVQFFIGIPIWLAITFGAKHEQAIEIPTQPLSNSWFGQFTEGELCYAMKTTAKLSLEGLQTSPQRAVFPLEIRNLSEEKLNFERLCIRPQHLNIYQGESRLWTNKGRVSYRGEDNWSRIVYTSKAPEFDQAKYLLGKARTALQRGAFLKTFDTFKQRADIP